ncbi:hypothetical protein JX266_010930 [Neoarthrinium moseri]|nr:hypothetical protein JX266_010930 [Neoarthrinium moseri]
MVYQYYPITGIKAGWGEGGAVPVRQEIDEWSEDPANAKQVDLFLHALRRFQDVPPGQRDSYFQVAGIHGMPYKAWDEPDTSDEDTKGKAYCTHMNALFPPWHRPYLLLYEQQIYEIMIRDIVPTFPEGERKAWRHAADTWRLPFWDWAVTGKVPKLAHDALALITIPPRGKTSIENPLHKFRMPNDKPMESEGVRTIPDRTDPENPVQYFYGACHASSRSPTEIQTRKDSKEWREGVVNNELVEKAITDHISIDPKKPQHGSAAEMVYYLLNHSLSYEEFATTGPPVPGEIRGVDKMINLEFIHNNIHYWVGGDGGHMSQIPVATFDPIFWLHHCNIDRLFGIWQQLNPDKWFTSGDQGPFDQKIIGIKETDKVTNKTPLRPFHKDSKGTVYTPDEVRDHIPLGYTYPEIQPWKPEFQSQGRFDREKYIKYITDVINEKYGKARKKALMILDQLTNNPDRGVPELPKMAGVSGTPEGSLPAMAIAVAIAEEGRPAFAYARAGGKVSPDQPLHPSQAAQYANSTEPVVGAMPGMRVGLDGESIKSNYYILSVSFSRFGLGGHPFNVEIFLKPEDQLQAQDGKKDFIGSVYNFSQPAIQDGEEVCSSCTDVQSQNAKMSACLPINLFLHRLIEQDALRDLSECVVRDVLNRLHWEVRKYGRKITDTELAGLDLNVTLSKHIATYSTDSFQTTPFTDNTTVQLKTAQGAGTSNADGNASSSQRPKPDAGAGADQSQTVSNAQYLALDKTIRLEKAVPAGGTIIVQSASVTLDPANVREDSTGISFMHFDESGSADRYDESNYDVLLSVSFRRKENVFRLNSKAAHGSWDRQDDLRLHTSWFKTPSPKIEVRDMQDKYEVYVDGAHVGTRDKKYQKSITHVQYWVKDDDQTTSMFSHALVVTVP